ncbi:MAG: flagellar M-ring protein FliF C-terminal domain-containing protein, partial [Pseudomonadota bacterium]
SVMVTTGTGGLSASHAKALKFVVASAVSGLTPEQVSVVDSEGGLISSGDDAETPALAAGDRAEALKANVERLLEARVGYGNAVVEINVDTVTEREQIVERRFDPDTRVAISTVTEETTTTAQDERGGAVTVAGNLPDGDAGGTGANSSSQESGTREQVNYEVSETQREVLRAPGAIRRLSVAVLVDGIRETGEDGSAVWSPRPDDELDALRALVASAVGFDEARGDVITLQSMEFLPIEPVGSEALSPTIFDQVLIDPMRLIQLGALALVSIILGLFVVRPILMAAPAPAAPAAIGPPLDDTIGAAAPALEADTLSGGTADDLPQLEIAGEMGELPSLDSLQPAGSGEDEPELTELVDSRIEETAAVLKEWLEDEATPA